MIRSATNLPYKTLALTCISNLDSRQLMCLPAPGRYPRSCRACSQPTTQAANGTSATQNRAMESIVSRQNPMGAPNASCAKVPNAIDAV